MRLKDRIIFGSFIVLAAAALLALPARLAAATPETGDKPGSRLEYRFDNDAFGAPVVQASPSGARGISKLSVRLYGGFNWMAAGDVNKGADGYFELFDLYTALGPYTAEGGYRALHASYDFGGDVIYQITPRLGVGVGAGYLRGSRTSRMSIGDGATTLLTVSGGPTLSAVPIRLGLFYNTPFSRKIDLVAGVGGAYYAGLKFEALTRLENSPTAWQEFSFSAQSSSANLGFHGSLGLEYKLSPTMGFFVEAVGRYARFKNFGSATMTSLDSDGDTITTEGKLYLVTEDILSGQITLLAVSSTPPTLETGVREPKFDLSGFSLQAGLRIRF